MDTLKNFDLEHWWNLLIAVGLAILLGALAASDRPLLIVGLGMIALGFGERLNHPKASRLIERTAFFPAGVQTWYPRVSCTSGILLDGMGMLLIALGLYRLLTA